MHPPEGSSPFTCVCVILARESVQCVFIERHAESGAFRHPDMAVLDDKRIDDEVVHQRFAADVAGQRHRLAGGRGMGVRSLGDAEIDARAMPGRNARGRSSPSAQKQFIIGPPVLIQSHASRLIASRSGWALDVQGDRGRDFVASQHIPVEELV